MSLNRNLELRYAAIAGACPRQEPQPDDRVGDLTVKQLRARFSARGSKAGLIYAGNQWLPPSRVFLGAQIFGNRRAFVPEKSAASRLWNTLGVSKPSLADCINVLEELASDVAEAPDEQILVNTCLYMQDRVQEAKARDRRRLETLPLWTGTGWKTDRPVYVTSRADIAAELSKHIALWQLPIATTLVPNLIEATGATLLDETTFDTIVHKNAYVEGKTIEPQFQATVHLLQDWLARHDPRLAEAHSVPWETLAAAQIACDRNLQLELRISRRSSIVMRAHAHVSSDPLTFFFSDTEAAGDDEKGGQTIASLFPAPDRDKLALAWNRCWTKAAKGDRGSVPLAADTGGEDSLQELFMQTTPKKSDRRSTRSAKRMVEEPHDFGIPTERPVRMLKNQDQLSVKTMEIVQGDTTATPPSKDGQRGLLSELPSGRPISRTGKPAPRSAPLSYSDKEKEELALQLLQRVIDGEATSLRDYRHLRGIGADALDKLRRYFEIKAHFGPLPDEITLTGAEAERARLEGNKYLLAVFGGLEKGYETVIKIIPDPLSNLKFKPNTSVTLSGITRSQLAGEVYFSDDTV